MIPHSRTENREIRQVQQNYLLFAYLFFLDIFDAYHNNVMPYDLVITHYFICYYMLRDIGLLGKIYGKCKGSMLH